jgi:tetratricopeptide (TPR) repeat protein
VEKKARRIDPLRDPGKPLPKGAPPPRFTDVTKEAGLAAFRTFAGKRTSQLPEDMGGGAAWGDFDKDGFDDLFLVSGGGPLNAPDKDLAPSRLYRNKGDGSFEEARDFPPLRIRGMGASWADYDNDGWLDLAVTGFDTLLLFRNEQGVLKRDTRFASRKGFWAGASWGDFNRDGRPDLYVCGYVQYALDQSKADSITQQFGLDVPYTLNPASFDAERNLLFRNAGNGRFVESAAQLGVANEQGRSLSALWHDFNDDGWLDLYVANDLSENKFYLNENGRFKDAGASAWISEYRGSMGLAAEDFDRDGDDDLFISHWVAQQFALYQSLTSENKDAKLAGSPGLRFTDVSEMMGIGPASMQKIGWGAAWADLDSDGWPDLLVANGSTFETKEAERRLVPMESFAFWNAQGKFFHDLAPWNRSLSAPKVSRGLAVSDYDNDGSMDVLIVDLDGGVRLLRNDIPHGNWIELLLDSRPGSGDGAKVVAFAGGRQMRATVTSASYLSQHTRRVHFGLGSRTKADRVEVWWPGGKKESWKDLDGNAIWVLARGEASAKRWGGEDPAVSKSEPLTRENLVRFWEQQRAGMDAMKRDNDCVKAIPHFRAALALNPAHEDSRYYLANCLVLEGDRAGAVKELGALIEMSPLSHRAWLRRGVLLAATARSAQEFDAAENSLRQALKINPEETGALLLLGEIAVVRRDYQAAKSRLELVNQANPRSAGALYLRGYVAWKGGDAAHAKGMLEAARKALGPEWKPKGSVAEGDVKKKMANEAGFLAPYWESWDGAPDANRAYARMEAYLRTRSGG